MYVDQQPPEDCSSSLAERHGFTIFPSVAEALTLGGNGLAVDGVLLIGEHGDYPINERGQTLYPRHELFSVVVGCGRASPDRCPAGVYHANRLMMRARSPRRRW